MNESLGVKIKELRTVKGWTLKEFGEKCSLSAGYLSLIERSLTSVNITSLQNIAKALDIDISSFFTPPRQAESCVVRSHEQVLFTTESSQDIYYSLAGRMPAGKGQLEPIIVQMKPEKEPKKHSPVSHDGEEFGYILEGIVTLIIENKEYELYHGDSYHILSDTPHVIMNCTGRIAKILYVNTPKVFQR